MGCGSHGPAAEYLATSIAHDDDVLEASNSAVYRQLRQKDIDMLSSFDEHSILSPKRPLKAKCVRFIFSMLPAELRAMIYPMLGQTELDSLNLVFPSLGNEIDYFRWHDRVFWLNWDSQYVVPYCLGGLLEREQVEAAIDQELHGHFKGWRAQLSEPHPIDMSRTKQLRYLWLQTSTGRLCDCAHGCLDGDYTIHRAKLRLLFPSLEGVCVSTDSCEIISVTSRKVCTRFDEIIRQLKIRRNAMALRYKCSYFSFGRYSLQAQELSEVMEAMPTVRGDHKQVFEYSRTWKVFRSYSRAFIRNSMETNAQTSRLDVLQQCLETMRQVHLQLLEKIKSERRQSAIYEAITCIMEQIAQSSSHFGSRTCSISDIPAPGDVVLAIQRLHSHIVKPDRIYYAQESNGRWKFQNVVHLDASKM